MPIKINLVVEPSATLAMNGRAIDKQAAGGRVYNLSAGEPMIPTHPLVIKEAADAMKSGKTLYTPASGVIELRQVALNWMNVTYKTNYSVAETLVTAGGKFGIYALMQAFIKPGDEVLVINPYWVSYAEITKMFGGVPKMVATEEARGWKVSVKDLKANLNSKTKILLLNNASNPAGTTYTRAEIKLILEFAVENNLLVISDEVYSGLMYDKAEFVSAGTFTEFKDNVVIIQSCSKHFAMTGWRVGFVFGNQEIIKTLSGIQSQSTSGAASISQWAAVAAFNNAAEIIPLVKAEMQTRRDIFVAKFNELFSVSVTAPSSGLYLFAALKNLGVKESNSLKFCLETLDKSGVAMVPGVAFGQEGYVRFSFGAKSAELILGLEKLSAYLKNKS